MKLYSNDLLLLLSLLSANQQFDQWRVLWGDTVESKVDVIDQTVDDETSVLDEIESRIDVLSPTLISSTGSTITISTPGNYRLQEDIVGTIDITSSSVDLDLNNRIVLGAIFIRSDQDFVTVHDGTLLTPADTVISDLYASIGSSTSDYVTLKDLVIVCDDQTTTAAGRDGIWMDGRKMRVRNCLIIAASAKVGDGALGGDGIVIRLSGSSHDSFVENCLIISGNGGSSTSVNGGAGGDGIVLINGTRSVIKGCTILRTGDGGSSSSATGGDGGHGMRITSAVKAFVSDCVIKNTGGGGSGSTPGTGGFAVQDNRASGSTVQNRVIRCRAHNIAGTNFELENSGVEDGVMLTYPPDATAVNAYTDVYVS